MRIEVTEAMLDAGADAYHQAREMAVAKAVARNDEHEKAGRGRVAAEHAFPNDWLEPVFKAMLAASVTPRLARGRS